MAFCRSHITQWATEARRWAKKGFTSSTAASRTSTGRAEASFDVEAAITSIEAGTTESRGATAFQVVTAAVSTASAEATVTTSNHATEAPMAMYHVAEVYVTAATVEDAAVTITSHTTGSIS